MKTGTRFEIIKKHLIDWYGITWGIEDLEDIAQYIALYETNDFEDILNLLNNQMGDGVEDGELDALAMEISEELEEFDK